MAEVTAELLDEMTRAMGDAAVFAHIESVLAPSAE